MKIVRATLRRLWRFFLRVAIAELVLCDLNLLALMCGNARLFVQTVYIRNLNGLPVNVTRSAS